MNEQNIDLHLARLKEIEELLDFPGVAGHMERAAKLVFLLAREAGNAKVLDLSMRLLNVITIHGRSAARSAHAREFRALSDQLRVALREVQEGAAPPMCSAGR